jgi:TRAP-type C4-dicarboxylate transport system substrate-binding protein
MMGFLIGGLVAGGAHATQLKIATLAPDGSAWMNAVRDAATKIEKDTDGRVQLRVYPGGSMGNESVVLRKMRIGQLHGGMFTAGTLATVYPDFLVYGLPLAFRSYAEVDQVRAVMDEVLMAGLADNGFIGFGVIEGGFAYLMSNTAVRSFDELAGQKAWTPEGDSIGRAILEAGGVAPIPLPVPDVLTGLQTGLIDAVTGPPVGAVALQWFTKVKYLTDLPVVYTYGSIVLSEKAFARLSAADQEVVREALRAATRELDRSTREDNERAKEALAKQGVQLVELTSEGAQRWQEVAAEATARLGREGVFSADIRARLTSLLEKGRAAGGE